MLTRIGQEPLFISLDEAKRQVIIDSSDDDALIDTYIRAATRRVGMRTGRVMGVGQFEYKFDTWERSFTLPVAPVREITEVAFLDIDGVERTISQSDWFETLGNHDAQVSFVEGFSGPCLAKNGGRVIVRFEAGYDVPDIAASGDDTSLERDPMDIVAVTMLVAHWYRNREAVGDKGMEIVPQGFEDIVAERRIYR